MSYRPDAQKVYGELSVLAQSPDLRPYFKAVRGYAQARDHIAIPGLFGAFAVEIERRAGQVVKSSDPPQPSDLLQSPVSFVGYQAAQTKVQDLVKASIPDPSPEFSLAVGDTYLRRDHLNVNDTNKRINENLSLAAGVVDRGRSTLANKGLQILPVVSEILRARGVDDPDRRAALVGPMGFTLLVGLSISEPRLADFNKRLKTFQDEIEKKGRDASSAFKGMALYQNREDVVPLFSDMVHVHEDEGEVKRLRWEGETPVKKAGCPMALIQNTIFRPAWNEVVEYAFRSGFEA